MTDRAVINAMLTTTVLVVLGLIANVEGWVIYLLVALVSIAILFGEPKK